jgi:hypothetical protein
VVLSHSRKGYSEVVWRQTTESFIRCPENSYRHFGGVPKTTVIDNLRAAVTRADWYDPEISPKVAEFCRHYGTVMMPTRPAMPRHKGKVEAGVKYSQNNAVKGRVFASMAEQNLFLSDWERTVADTRIHGTTRQQVIKLFNEVERSKLLPLPTSLFPVFEEAPRSVHRDGYVEVQRAYYSVPPEYVGRQVWVRWESKLVRVFNHLKTPSNSVGVVVCGAEVVGLFAVTDWMAAVGTLLAEMEANGLTRSFKIGRLCDDEGIWRPCFPKDSTDDFEAIAQRYLDWAKAFIPPGADDLKSLL